MTDTNQHEEPVTDLGSSSHIDKSGLSNPPKAATTDEELDEILLRFRLDSLHGGKDPAWNSRSNMYVNAALNEALLALQARDRRLALEAQREELKHWADFFADPSMNAVTPAERLLKRIKEFDRKLALTDGREEK